MKGFYQPAGLVGWVSWTWILMIALFGMIMWLEVTTLNVWTYVSFFVFVVVAAATILRRRVTLEDDALRFPHIIGMHTEKIHFKDMEFIQFNKHTFMFSHDGEQYSFWMGRRMLQALQEKIEG